MMSCSKNQKITFCTQFKIGPVRSFNPNMDEQCSLNIECNRIKYSVHIVIPLPSFTTKSHKFFLWTKNFSRMLNVCQNQFICARFRTVFFSICPGLYASHHIAPLHPATPPSHIILWQQKWCCCWCTHCTLHCMALHNLDLIFALLLSSLLINSTNPIMKCHTYPYKI